MDSIFHNIFITKVYKQKLPFNLKDLIAEIQLIEKSDASGRRWSKKNYKNGYTSYGSLDKLHKFSSSFEMLEKKIDIQTNKYLKTLDYLARTKSDLKMTHCWINIMPANSQHTAHIHPQSVISGTFYVTMPEGASSIKFEDPRMGFFMNAPQVSQHAKSENKRYLEFPCKPGEVVLFESWLRHEVPTNFSKLPRISISFNYGWV